MLITIYTYRIVKKKCAEERRTHYLKGLQFFITEIQSPLNLCYSFILFIGVGMLFPFFLLIFFPVNVTWILYDPFYLIGRGTRSMERLMGETRYSLLFACYGVILFVWNKIYLQIRRSKDDVENTQKMAFYQRVREYRLGGILIWLDD